MNWKHADLAAILQTTDAHIILVQEPSKVPLVPSCSDTDPDGIAIYGTVKHSLWETYLPPFQTPYPHVVTFVKKMILPLFTISTIDCFASYHSLGLSFTHLDFSFHLLNFYHHVTDKTPNLSHLLHTHIDDAIPTILCGDFNTHSCSWSPPNISPSLWLDSLELWLDNHSFFSTVPEHTIT